MPAVHMSYDEEVEKLRKREIKRQALAALKALRKKCADRIQT